MVDSPKETQDTINTRIQDLNDELEYQDSSIKRITNDLIQQGIPESVISEYIDVTATCVYPGVSDADKAVAQDKVVKLLNSHPDLEKLMDSVQNKSLRQWDLTEAETELEAVQSDSKNINKKEKEEKQQQKEVEQNGHIYPIKLVTAWTNKLKQYNKQMEDFIKELDDIDPITVDATWICKKIESFCRKINYYLALLRYEIIRTLHRAYKQTNKFADLIDPIVNFNPTNILQCLQWVKNVIKFFFGPYMKAIEFIQDFMTYTPPLVQEAVTLVKNVASVPGKLLSKIEIVAENKEGEKKQLVEIYKDYIQIKMEPISMKDIHNGPGERPSFKPTSTTDKQKQLYEKAANTSSNELDQIWSLLINHINSVGSSSGYSSIWAAYPVKQKQLGSGGKWYTQKQDLVTSDPVSQCDTAYTMAVKIFGKKTASTGDYYSKSINTTLHAVYKMVDVDEFKGLLSGTLQDFVKSYYTIYWKKSPKRADVKKLESYKKQIDFIKAYSSQFPKINDYLDQYGEEVKKLQISLEKVEDLEKPDVFN